MTPQQISATLMTHIQFPDDFPGSDKQKLADRIKELEARKPTLLASPLNALNWCVVRTEPSCWYQRTMARGVEFPHGNNKSCHACARNPAKSNLCLVVSFVEGQELVPYDPSDNHARWFVKKREDPQS